MVSNLYLCPWDHVVWSAGGHDGAQQIADLWCVLPVTPGSRPPALIGQSRSPDMKRKVIQGLWIQGSGDCQALSLTNEVLMHFISMLNAQVCNLAISIIHIFLTHFLLPCSSAYTCPFLYSLPRYWNKASHWRAVCRGWLGLASYSTSGVDY